MHFVHCSHLDRLKMTWKKSITILCLFYGCAYAANILFLNILPSPSHHFWSRAVLNALAKNGHNITAISPDIDRSPPSEVHYIQIEGTHETGIEKIVKALQKTPDQMNPLSEVQFIFKTCEILCAETLQSSAVSSLLHYPDRFTFDLVLYDFAVGPCLLPFLHRFGNPPLVGLTAYGYPSYIAPVVGGHQYYSYVPHNFVIADDNMTFWQRIFNLVLHMEEYYYYQFVLTSSIDKLAVPYFGAGTPSVSELERRMSVVLVNTNPAMDYLAPLPENIIPVGGLHIEDPKPLPKDIGEFMNSSRKGVVLFSLGSNFRSDFMPIEKQRMFIEVFDQLSDYNFLWKFESNIPSEQLPKNVRICSWLPLSNAMAHPKTKLIIFHGGLLTTQEALWRALPMVMMPFGLDQHQNLIKTKRMGVSEGLSYIDLSPKHIKDTLVKVLTNATYLANAIKMSKVYQDQKERPLDRAIWWIEWALRNPNAKYFKSPAIRLGFFVGNSFDIIIFILLIAVAVLVLLAMMFFYLIKQIVLLKRASVPKSKIN